MRIGSILLVSALGTSMVTSVYARVRPQSIEAGAFGGVWEGDRTLESAPVFGVRAAYNFTRVLGVEGSYGLIPTTLSEVNAQFGEAGTAASADKTAGQLGVNLVMHLNNARINPYVTGGVGLVHVDDVHFASNVGMGAKFHFTDMIAARADFRGWFAPNAPADDDYAHFEATLGISVQFAGNTDIDADGVPNSDDQCPTSAEDKDGFEDTDGCPDLDNDKDGVADGVDKCPDAAEDKDDFEDEDGCPDIDADKDGVDDKTDKCVDKAEDKDGFEDEDGCPDLDNDKDGIEDAKDKCPDVAESKNGFEDTDGCPEEDADKDGLFDSQDQCKDKAETTNGFKDADGCPDEIPADLAAVQGIVSGVRFVKKKGELDKRSAKALDALAEVLKKHSKDAVMVLACTAHKVHDADAVANTRAAAVKAALVELGVAAEMLETRSLGAKDLPEVAPKGSRNDRLEVQIKVVSK